MNKSQMDEESFKRRLNAAINKKKKEMKIIKQEKKLRKLAKIDSDLEHLLSNRRKDKREDKFKKKRNERLGTSGQLNSMNYNVGDNRFHENYKCDYKLRLMDREKELANSMSKA